MKRYSLLLLILLLTACLPSSGNVESLNIESSPAPESTPAPTPINEPDPKAYVDPDPLSEEVEQKALEKLVADLESGKVKVEDLSGLNIEQRKELSIAYAELLNAKRGINPIIYNNEAYIDPITGKMKSTADGSTKEQQTIEMYVPIVTDEEGYIHVMDETGEWIKIENSRGVNFQIFDTLEEVRAEITIPTTEKLGAENGERAGLTVPEAMIAGLPNQPGIMMPAILLDKDLGEIYLSGGGKIPTQEMLIVEDAYAARKMKVSAPALRLYEEGSDLDLRSSGFLQTHFDIFETMKENAVYYLIFSKNQRQHFSNTFPVLNGNEATSNYRGLVKSDSTIDILSGENKSKDFVWIDIDLLIIADN